MKKIRIGVVFFLLTLGISSLSDAQLINYGRRSKFLGNSESSQPQSIPSWANELPEPQTKEEERYDINRDGKLQSAEIKIYLRSVVERVEARGYVSVTSDLLREYDKNRDGMINTNEIILMKEHVR